MKTTKVLFYCTVGKPYLYKDVDNKFKLSNKPVLNSLNGKVVAECEVETEELNCACVPYRNKNNLGYEHYIDNGVYKVNWSSKDSINDNLDGDGVVFERNDKYIDTMLNNDDLSKMCLSPQQLYDYVGLENEFYALHIKNLKIFDNPQLLRTYCVYYLIGTMPMVQRIQKAPQNMMRVYDYKGNPYIVISIRSPWLCKIFNGEKEIEVRTKVMKEML